jgi:tetratricopeptide (TPR) repeat protein
MREARESGEIETFLFAMKRETRHLGANATSMLEFRNVSLTPEEAYILSRVDGHVTPTDIFSVSPLSETDSARALLGFLRTGLISFAETTETTKAQPQSQPQPQAKPQQQETENVASREEAPKETASAESEKPKDPIQCEVEELLTLSKSQDDREVLGVTPDANLAEIKRAFHKKVFRFHPDRHSTIEDEAFQKNLSRLFTRLSDAFAALTDQSKTETTTEPATQELRSAPPARTVSRAPEKPTPNWNDPKKAHELFQAAQLAYQKEDYFRTIEYCQKAIEIDQSQAEYFYLLGKALSENPKWKHDAEKNLRMATELDPSRPEYLAALGKLYQSEGLGSRAKRTFDKLKALDPNYPIPNGA